MRTMGLSAMHHVFYGASRTWMIEGIWSDGVPVCCSIMMHYRDPRHRLLSFHHLSPFQRHHRQAPRTPSTPATTPHHGGCTWLSAGELPPPPLWQSCLVMAVILWSHTMRSTRASSTTALSWLSRSPSSEMPKEPTKSPWLQNRYSSWHHGIVLSHWLGNHHGVDIMAVTLGRSAWWWCQGMGVLWLKALSIIALGSMIGERERVSGHDGKEVGILWWMIGNWFTNAPSDHIP